MLAMVFGGMPSIGELSVIAVILILLFGAKKLPGLARALGSSISEFKKGRKDSAADEAKNMSSEGGDA